VLAHPDVEFIRPCNLCPHMKRITLPKILDARESMEHAIEIDPEVAARARKAVERMVNRLGPGSAFHRYATISWAFSTATA
jgi:quinolinate synthase